MDCEKVKAQLSAYIDDEVAEKDAAFIREHIAVCADCGQEEQLLRKTSQLLRHWENVPAPDGFCEALLAKAEDVSLQPRRGIIEAVRPLAGPRALIKVAVYGAAIVLLCFGFAFFARPPLRRSPMVEPLPTQEAMSDVEALYITPVPVTDAGTRHPSLATRYYSDDTTQASFERLPRYTTMAEVKVAGIWK